MWHQRALRATKALRAFRATRAFRVTRALRATRASDESLQSEESSQSLQSDESAQSDESETCKNERKRRLSIENVHVKSHRGEKKDPKKSPFRLKGVFFIVKNGCCDWRTFFGACFFTLWEFTCKFAFEGRFSSSKSAVSIEGRFFAR